MIVKNLYSNNVRNFPGYISTQDLRQFHDVYVGPFLAYRMLDCQRSVDGFTSFNDLEEHEAGHRRQFTCSKCDFSARGFSFRRALKDHIQRHHMQAEDFVVPPTIHRLEHHDYRNQDSYYGMPAGDANASFSLDFSGLETTDFWKNFKIASFLCINDADEQSLQDANQSGLAFDPLTVPSDNSTDREISQMQGSYNQSSKQIASSPNYAHEDYQMQLLLLEQQNKKRERLRMEREQQEARTRQIRSDDNAKSEVLQGQGLYSQLPEETVSHPSVLISPYQATDADKKPNERLLEEREQREARAGRNAL